MILLLDLISFPTCLPIDVRDEFATAATAPILGLFGFAALIASAACVTYELVIGITYGVSSLYAWMWAGSKPPAENSLAEASSPEATEKTDSTAALGILGVIRQLI